MSDELELLKKRFVELAEKSERGLYYTFTDFLGLCEQSALAEVLSKNRYLKPTLFGGVEGAERYMACFGDEEEIGYPTTFPIVTLKVAPVSQKFADKLTHRDILGSLMSLGIERDKLGDIVLVENVAYVFVHEDIAEYIIGALARVKNTEVRTEITDSLPKESLYKTENRTVQISSERLDAVIAKVYHLSRDDAQMLFRRSLVYVGGKECQSLSYTPKVGDKVTVRGYGRFVYNGVIGLSKKGKLNVEVLVYI